MKCASGDGDCRVVLVPDFYNLATGNHTDLVTAPDLLPKMDFSKGIPREAGTIVVIPTVLSGPGDVPKLLESLEIRYLANQDDNLYFALLTDLRNAPERELPGDAETVDLLAAWIADLNRRYRPKSRIPSSSCTGPGPGMHKKGSGWDMRGNGGSSRLSVLLYREKGPMHSPVSWATWRSWPVSGM